MYFVNVLVHWFFWLYSLTQQVVSVWLANECVCICVCLSIASVFFAVVVLQPMVAIVVVDFESRCVFDVVAARYFPYGALNRYG